jgi:glucose 1-dehydrogenase
VIDLAGRVVVVTGGASVPGVGIGSGVGAGICRGFAAAGASVVVHYRSAADEAAALVSELRAAGGSAIAAGGDLGDEAACDALVDAAVAAYGGLDVLVNNAAVQPVQALEGMRLADWRAVVDANLAAVFAMTQAGARVMAARGGGSIIHIASIEGRHPAFNHAHYDASKAAVVMHARAAAIEYGPLGIRVNTVSPGLIARDGIEDAWPEGVARWRAAAPLGRLGTPGDVANACLFLASPMADWITGHDLVVDGGMTSHPLW